MIMSKKQRKGKIEPQHKHCTFLLQWGTTLLREGLVNGNCFVFCTLGYSFTGAYTFSASFTLGPDCGGSCNSAMPPSVSLVTMP